MDFWNTIAADASVAGQQVDPQAPLLKRLLQVRRGIRHRPGFACVFWFRVNHYMLMRGWRGHYRLRVWRQYRFSNDISPQAQIGAGLLLPHYTDITIGSRVQIGPCATIYNGVTLGSKHHNGEAAMPIVGKNVVIYTGAKIFGGIAIGDNVDIGALTLCNKDIPAGHVVYGIPPNVTAKQKSSPH